MEARYYERLGDGKVQCHLCPHECMIAPGKSGFCRVRSNEGGMLIATTYGRAAAVALDPIEKKPLYHYYPGSYILSIGQAGCTFKCDFCQNWHLLDADIPQEDLSPARAVELARREASFGIAYTYNEPYVGFEFLVDTCRLAREAGLKNVLVTNGYYMPDPFAELAPLTDAMNIDLKSIRQGFYREYVHGDVAPVQRTIEAAFAGGIHIEVTNLLIPGLNDSEADISDLVEFMSRISPDIPMHFSGYHPSFKMKLPPTPVSSLDRAYAIARRKLKYVYIGNVSIPRGNDSACPQCGAVLVRRAGYAVQALGLDAGKCRKCGTKLYFVTK